MVLSPSTPVNPAQFGLGTPSQDIQIQDAEQSKAMILDVLNGQQAQRATSC
jgi:anthranilate phosphoribosyltransferase